MRRGVVLWLSLGAVASGLALTMCSSNGTTAGGGDPCPQGICGSGGSGSGSGSGSSGSGVGGHGCAESWTCTPWETNGKDNNGTRTCTDKNNCGTTGQKPVESAMLPALDLEYYKCNVEPIFDRGCAMMGCHGTEQGRALRVYARGRLRHAGEMLVETGCNKPGAMKKSEDCIGSIECVCWTAPHTPTEWQKNFDAARGFGLDAKGQPIPAAMEDSSDLIAQPIVGGKAHAGVHLFASGDPDQQTLKSWLSGTKLGMACGSTN